MIDILIVLIFFSLVYVIFIILIYIIEDNEKMILSAIGAILLVFVMWGILRHLTQRQNYRIDKNVVFEKHLVISKGIDLEFNKKLKVEIVQYSMPNGSAMDYNTYKIYIDSVNYIEYKSNMYDSLDMKYGKKLYTEKL